MSYPYDPDYVVPPGETLREWFDWSNLPHSCVRLYGITDEELAGILDATLLITADLAKKLDGMTGVRPAFWLAMEHNYRVGLAAGKTRL